MARSWAYGATLLALAAAAGAQEIGDDPHLDAAPRTADEAAKVTAATARAASFAAPEPFEARPGGAATSMRAPDANAFSHPSTSLDFAGELDFRVGNGLFRKLWVTAPASTRASDGLGPLYNARACQSCHLKDGRGHPPLPGEAQTALFLKLSVPAAPGQLAEELAAIEDYIATAPEPTYGAQLQTFGIAGHPAEARLEIDREEIEVRLSGGEIAQLRKPSYRIADPAYGPMRGDVMTSPRIAQQMIGLGLLEAIPSAEILARADPDDADGDGISGRASVVFSEAFGRTMLGRFGHKAGKATVREQSAAAFAGDIGISTDLHPAGWGDCTPKQAACRATPHGGEPEAETVALDLVTFYARHLAVPARRNLDDPEALRGKAIFHGIGCAACHTPKHVTARLPEEPALSFQLIWPYTDLLLHDMGEGLADGRPEGVASGREWRTAPLWGIGLTETVTGRASFLHDGRARTLLEAVLWHGGEAQTARDAVVGLEPSDRAALIRFLESL